MSSLRDKPGLSFVLHKFLRRLNANPVFEAVTVSVILISSITIGMKSYSLHTTIGSIIYFLDSLITLYFLIEITIRILGTRGYWSFFKDPWNVFDFIVVTVSLIPIDESEYALLARLLRLFRVLRLIYIIPQLQVLITALLTAIPRIGYVALLMFIIFYIYASLGHLLFQDINPQLWGNVGRALLTLFRVTTFEDWTDVMYETMEVMPWSWIYYLTFIFLSVYVFLNMMIGVIIDTINKRNVTDAKEGNAQIMDKLLEIDARLGRLEQPRNDKR